MTASFLITLREGLEASLIISIILAFLGRMGRKDQFRSIWLGTGLALLASLAAGGVIFLTVGALEGRPEEIFEGLAMFLAVVAAYGFTTAAMLVPAIYEFDVATGRTTIEE